MWSRRVQRALAGVSVMTLAAVPAAARQAQPVPPAVSELAVGLTLRQESYAPEVVPAVPPVELRFFLKPGPEEDAQRLVASTRAALLRFSAWYGAFPYAQLTVIDAPWNSRWVGAVYPGTVVSSTRQVRLSRDYSFERGILAAVGRQYWFGTTSSRPDLGWFEEGLAKYSSARAIDIELGGMHFLTPRFFGGFLPFPLRSAPLSPLPDTGEPRFRDFEELRYGASPAWRRWEITADGEVQRTAEALHTLERFIGWPALQQGLAGYRDRFRAGTGTPTGLATVISEQRGRDLSWFFNEAFRFPARFDYGIEAFSSVPEGAKHRIALKLRRYGDAVFAGTVEPRELSAARALAVSIRLEDGTDLREWWDGRDAALDLEYLSVSPAVLASVDPEGMLLLDADRGNNTRALRPAVHPNGARLTLNWLVWLQDLVLSYAALV